MNSKRIVACIDGSALTEAVCDYAAWIAQRVGAPLKLLHSINHHPETAPLADLSGNIGLDSGEWLLEEITRIEEQRSKLRLQQGKVLLQAAKQRAQQAGVSEPILSQRHGSLLESLIELEDDIRVLVLGLRGKVHENRPDRIGAKLEAIIRSLHQPILVVNGPFSPPRRIMIAYDGGKAADKAVEMVAGSALFEGVSCHLVGVAKDGQNAPSLENAAATLKGVRDMELIVKTLAGKPEQVLSDYQTEQAIDLTIMGAFSHTRIHDLLLGSFTVKMLTQSRKPLLLLR